MSSSLCAAVVLTLPSTVATRKSGVVPRGGGGGDRRNDAPPLEVATVVACSLLFLATIFLLCFSLRALFFKYTRLPAAGVVLTLILGGITYALDIVLVVKTDMVDYFGLPVGRFKIFPVTSHLQTLSDFFKDFKDIAIFVAIALVLRNRYPSIYLSSPGLIWFTSMAFFLPIMMVVFFATGLGIVETVNVAVFGFTIPTISEPKAKSRLTTASNLYFVFVAFHILGTIFLTISACLVKARTKDGRVMTLTLFVIIPLLFLYSLARLIFVVIKAVLPMPDSLKMEVSSALNFSIILISGALHTAILSVLVFLIRRLHLWDTPPRSFQSTSSTQGTPLAQDAPIFSGTHYTRDTSTSQFFAMGAPPGQSTPPTGDATPPQIFVHSPPPEAQFPGQSENLQQPQEPQTGSSHLQPFPYSPVSPNQSPLVPAPAKSMTQASLHPT